MNLAIKIPAVLLVAFAGGWLLAYFDQRMTLAEYAKDYPHLLPRMLFGLGLMFAVFVFLEPVFG